MKGSEERTFLPAATSSAVERVRVPSHLASTYNYRRGSSTASGGLAERLRVRLQWLSPVSVFTWVRMR